nr:hypothetical protein [Tanacetum cinerariifolium]
MHMLSKPQAFYDNVHKQALGYQNPFYLKRAKQNNPTMYDRIVLFSAHEVRHVADNEESLILAEESRLKMIEKQKDPEMAKKKVNCNPINYAELNKLSEDFGKLNVNDESVDTCEKYLKLEAGFLKKNDVFNELSKRLSHLEKHCISLEVAMQLSQEIFQKDISYTKQSNHDLQEYFELNDLKAQLQAKDTIITTFKEKVKALKAQLQEKGFANAALKNELRKLKGKKVVDTAISKPKATTIAPGMLKITTEPLAPKLFKNKDAYIDYIQHSREHIDILWEIVKDARALSPLDYNLNSSCKYAQRIQEVLVYVRHSCPCLTTPRKRLIVVTPMNKDIKVRPADPVTSSKHSEKLAAFTLRNKNKQVYITQVPESKESNLPLLHSTGVICSTSASESKPSGNTKKYKISQ